MYNLQAIKNFAADLDCNNCHNFLMEANSLIHEEITNNIPANHDDTKFIKQCSEILSAAINDILDTQIDDDPASLARNRVAILEELFSPFMSEVFVNHMEQRMRNKNILAACMMAHLQKQWDSLSVQDYLLHCTNKRVHRLSMKQRIQANKTKMVNTVFDTMFPYSSNARFLTKGLDRGRKGEIQIGIDKDNVALGQWMIDKEKSKIVNLSNRLMNTDAKGMMILDRKYSINTPTAKGNLVLILGVLLIYSGMKSVIKVQEDKITDSVLKELELTPQHSISGFLDILMFPDISYCTPEHQSRIIKKMNSILNTSLFEHLQKNDYKLDLNLDILRQKRMLESAIEHKNTKHTQNINKI